MKLTLNLASRTYVNRRLLYLGYALVLGTLVLLLAFGAHRAWRLRAHSLQLGVQLSTLEKTLGEVGEETEPVVTAAEMARQKAQVTSANAILERDGFRWTVLLDRLEEMTLEGVTIVSLQPDYKARSLRLTGQARSLKELRAFLDRLITSPAFSEVYLLQQGSAKVKTASGAERPALGFSLVLKGVF